MTTHMMRPGPIRGTQILCEQKPTGKHRDDLVAELSARGLAQVDCRDCLMILGELRRLPRVQ